MNVTETVAIVLFGCASVLVTSTAVTSGQEHSPEATPYCSDLKRVAALAHGRDRFASITGKPREGNFSETSRPLTGWRDCSLYGAGMYTCDSQGVKSAEEA